MVIFHPISMEFSLYVLKTFLNTNTPILREIAYFPKRFCSSNLYAGGSGVRLNDGPDIKLFIFLSVAWPIGVQLLVFFCSSVPVVVFDTPGISRCRSQHVSVESSSLLHHSIYL